MGHFFLKRYWQSAKPFGAVFAVCFAFVMADSAPSKKRLREARRPLSLFQVIEYCQSNEPDWALFGPTLEPLMSEIAPSGGVPYVSLACPCLTLRHKDPIAIKRREHIKSSGGNPGHFGTVEHQRCTWNCFTVVNASLGQCHY